MKKFLANKAAGFYVNAVAALVGLVVAVIYLAYSTGVESFDFRVFALMMVGVAAAVGLVFVDVPFLSVVAVLFYAAAFGMYVGSMLALFGFYLTDTWEVSGSLEIMETVIFILGMMGAGMIIAIVSGFMRTRKKAQNGQITE